MTKPKEGIVSREDYVDISAQYEERIRFSEEAMQQVHREMDKLLDNSTDQQVWMQDFIEHKNLTTLTRVAAVELIEEVQIYEGKRLAIKFRHTEEFDLLSQHITEFTEMNTTEKEAI